MALLRVEYSAEGHEQEDCPGKGGEAGETFGSALLLYINQRLRPTFVRAML